MKINHLLTSTFLTFTIITFLSTNVNAQKTTTDEESASNVSKGNPADDKANQNLTYVKKEIKIDKFYTKDELMKIPKLELREIYKKRITYIVEVLPFISLHQLPGATLHDMGIPATEGNIKHLEKEKKNKQQFLNSLYLTLDDIIPYSDKSNIIWAILFFDDMIKKSSITTK